MGYESVPTIWFIQPWLSNEELNNIDLGKYKEDSNDGLILEVDLEYPNDLHELHNDYPLTLEKVKVSKDMLSEYCNKIIGKVQNSFWYGKQTNTNAKQ